MDNREKVETYFKEQGIMYEIYEHAPVFTVAEVHEHGIHKDGVIGAKNLFLTNLSHDRFFLFVLPDDMRADLKSFAEIVGEKKVTFGSADELLKYMRLTPGSVSLCGLLNDAEKKVEVYVRTEVYNAPLMHLHPNVNTASMELTHGALMKFFESLEREIKVVNV